MKLRPLLIFALTTAGVSAAASLVHAANPAARAPNIIVILADDMGPGDLGCYGGTQAPTPRIDRLAREGTRFTQFYSAAPICSPSRCGIITGMYPARWRITSFLQTKKGNAECEQDDFLDPRAPSLPRTLKAAGYATAHIGKWHLGGGRDVTEAPKFAAYGYDEGVGTYESPEPHPDITATNWIWSDKDKVKRWNRTAFFVDKTLDFLDRHRDGPCFVNLWPDVHTPWVPDDVSDKKDLPKNFHPVLGEFDKQIGRLLDGLKSRGLEENTLVVFTSDNGALPSFNGARSGGFRGNKLALYEGGIRMPFIVRWPGRVPAGRVDDRSVLVATDLLPTLSSLAGAKLPGGQALDGLDVSAIWRGGAQAQRGPVFWEYGRNGAAVFKFGPDPSPTLAVRRDRWKLLINPDGSRAELYDLATDVKEANNLAAAKPEVVRELKQLVMDWRATWSARK